MPQNVEVRFGRSNRALADAQEYLSKHADDEGVLSIIEVFDADLSYKEGEYGRIWVVSSDRLPKWEADESIGIAIIDGAGLETDEVPTPYLVREFADIKCADARGEPPNAERHRRLGVVVDELRKRGVLD